MIEALVALIAVGIAFFIGERRGRSNENARQEAAIRRAVEKAKEVRDEVGALDDVGLAQRAAEWLHDK